MEQAAEAAAAAAGGVFSAGVLFPLEVTKTNLQALIKRKKSGPSKSSTDDADADAAGEGGDSNATVDALAAEGPATPATTAAATTTTSHAREEDGIIEDAGSLSGGAEEVKDGDRLLGTSTMKGEEEQEEELDAAPSVESVVRDIYSREGLPGFYKGVWYASGQSGLEKAAYFYGYGWLKALALAWRGRGGKELSTATDLGLGYLAEAFHLPLTIPIEVVLTKIMTSKDKTTALAVIQGILTESGPAGFYKGIQAYFVLCLKPAIQYAVFNRLKALTLAYRTGAERWGETKELTAVQAFVIGAISRAVATVVVFPYIRAKVIIMSRTGTPGGDAKATSILASLVGILKDEGVSALYQGIAPEITRGVLSAALMLMVKEKIQSAAKGAIVGRRK